LAARPIDDDAIEMDIIHFIDGLGDIGEQLTIRSIALARERVPALLL
jgi:hypothetical protein